MLFLFVAMRCYYDHQIFMTQAKGGISRYFFELVQRLGRIDGVKPTVFTGIYLSQLPLHSLAGCQVLGIKRPFRIGPLMRVVHQICNATNQQLLHNLAPAIYHPTYYRPAFHPPGTRLVLTVYDMIHERFPNFFPGDDTVEIKFRACRAADAIICISHSAREDLLNFYPQFEPKTSVIYLAAASDHRLDVATASNPDVSAYALFVGSRKGYKGFNTTLDAWQQLMPIVPDLRLVCVGGGAFTALESAEIKIRGLEDQISQQVADDKQLIGLYRNAALFIYPSQYEGFGLPVLEAMACGCPVICSRSSSLPEVGGKAARYFEPEDASGLAACVVEIFGNATLREELIEAGYEQQKKFTWNECARQTAQVYRQCLEEAIG